MKSTFKNKLLLGAAVTALSFGAVDAANAAGPYTLTGAATWDVSTTNGMDNTAASGDTVNLDTFTLTIDGAGSERTIGAITGSTGDISITTQTDAAVTTTIASITLTGAGDITSAVTDQTNRSIATTVSGALSTGGGITMTIVEPGGLATNLLDINGNATVVGTTTLTGGNHASASTSTLTLDGATNAFTGVVTLNGGSGGADADAILNVNGTSNTFTNGIVLNDDGTDGDAVVNIANTATGTFTGTINAPGATDEGTVNVVNGTNRMTFASAIGATGTEIETLNIGTEAGAAGTAEFDAAVLAGTINVNGEVGATVADFDGDITATAMNILTGSTATDTANVTMSGTTLAIGTLTLDDQEGTIDATLTFDGTSLQTFTGDLTVQTGGEGVVNVNNDVLFVGRVGSTASLGALNVATGKTFTLREGGAANAITSTNLAGTGTFVYDTLNAGGDSTLTGAITATTDGAGVFRVTGAHTAIVTGAVGTSTNDVGAIQVTGLADTDGLTLQGNVYANGIAIDATNATDSNTVTLGAGANGDTVVISGSVTSAENNEHTLVLAANTAQTITGSIGASGAAFATLTVTESATVGGSIYATNAGLANGETLTLTGTAATVSSNVAGTGADNRGTIIVGTGTAASATFTGEIGDFVDDTRNSIAALTVDGNATATFNEDVQLGGALTVGDAAAAATATFVKGLQFAGASTVDGTVLFGNRSATVRNEFDNTLAIGGNQASTVTLAGGVNVDGALTIGAQGATFLIKKTATFDPADADGNGTANQATDAILDATGVGITRTGTLTVGISPDTDAIDSGTNIQVALDDGTGAWATGVGNNTIVLQDTAFIDLVNNTSTATALLVTVNARAAADVIGSGSQGVNAADSLLAISNATATNELGTIKGNLQGAATTQTATDIAESIAPTVDAGGVVGATSFVNSVGGITNTQLAALRDGTETGMVAGNISQGLRAWGQVFGQTGEQDRRDGIAGYEIDTYGIAVGMDTETLADNWIWGLGFAYADTEVDSNNVNNTETEIDSYQVTLYANYDVDDRTYVAGQLGYVWGENDQTRSNIGGAGLVANADYDSDTIIARLEAGRKYAAGHSTTLTPKVMMNYQHYDADGYTESGTVGNAGLIVDSESLNLFEIGVGVDASWDYQNADGSYWQPKIGVGVRHDLIGDEYETTSTFGGTGGPIGNSFETQGFDPAQTTFNIGADMTYFSNTNWELSAGYDFEYKSDYDSHSGTLRAAYKF